ncbi:MAG: cobalamin-binding protein [Verrucomicrobia bacterium]|nr:cobalamin-binding protein [Verrucomicrobiota bacterium]MBU4429658.1 cobalamin-binding protein [Verrucomicrobiota bacterium]
MEGVHDNSKKRLEVEGIMYSLTRQDRLGLIRPALDAHMLGLVSVAQMLADCGYPSIFADASVCEACNSPEDIGHSNRIREWITAHRITAIGFSYRLDPQDGADLFSRFLHQLADHNLLHTRGGPIRAVYFAGLPETCKRVRKRYPTLKGFFCGDETPDETLRIFGIDTSLLPPSMASGLRYDEDRLAFGRELIRKGDYLAVKPVERREYKTFGSSADTVIDRLNHGQACHLPPLMRAHVGPYLPDRKEAVSLFLKWTRQLAASGFLDILSIGTSQLTQSDFGGNCEGKPNGGGVPFNSKEEFAAVWQAARPMLVRTYAGTRNIPDLAKMYEATINMAWHALSLWWFCRIDGRGPYSVLENLQQHIETLRYIAGTGKPFEPNVPHHFAFRGADDVTYIVSAVVAAKMAKVMGIRYLILQNMLNTPRYTWGVQDLAKSRAMLHLVRELEEDRFQVILQPRGGLDYFSPDLNKAKAQLAAVTALMDDIEPHNPASPPIIHVVSYSEASHLADPDVVNESIKITRHALIEFRKLRTKGLVDSMTQNTEVVSRTKELISEARSIIKAIESVIPNPYSAEGLYKILAGGFLPVPYLWECRDEFHRAVSWQTRLVRGSVKVVDKDGMPIHAADRMRIVLNSNLVPASERIGRKRRKSVNSNSES